MKKIDVEILMDLHVSSTPEYEIIILWHVNPLLDYATERC
jgi:hypothetical protein